ncbi:uncharacterized protein LOC135440831 [Drosophila montana]|uniref:uncharacterized protein LOC135440831 n=1 Tax=Drosophila montana TaxID=40370 RepID=UPI00313B20AD
MPTNANGLVGGPKKFYGNGRRLKDGLEIRKKTFRTDVRRTAAQYDPWLRLRFRSAGLEELRQVTAAFATDILDDMVAVQMHGRRRTAGVKRKPMRRVRKDNVLPKRGRRKTKAGRKTQTARYSSQAVAANQAALAIQPGQPGEPGWRN